MPELAPRSCPLCGFDDARPVLTASDLNERTTPERFSLVRCASCAFVYLGPAPPAEELGRYYPAHYRAHQRTDAAGHSRRRERRLSALLQRRSGRLLDVGCGSGGDLVRMHEAGWDCTGVEIDPGAVAAARTRGLIVVKGRAEALPASLGTFDAVTLFHALEHFWDPLAVLRGVRDRLRPGGVLLIRVPNFGSIESRLFGPYWFPLEVPRHLNFFTPPTLVRALYHAGLRVGRMETRYQIGSLRYSWRNWRRATKPPDFKRHRLTREAVRILTRLALAFRSGNELIGVAVRP